MKSTPWFKFFPSDWLSGTRGLSASETGIYITLIAMMYDHGKPLSMDQTRLARICGATQRQLAAALERLIADGKIIRLPGGLWNSRVASEMQSRDEKISCAREAAFARHLGNTLEDQGSSDADASIPQCGNDAISEARYQKEEEPKGSSGELAFPEPQLPLKGRLVLLDMATASEAVEAFNAMAAKAGLPKVQKFTTVRRKQLAQRLKDCGGIDGWRAAMDKVAASDFLTGRKTTWRADFDFILQATSFTKIMEGSYDNRQHQQGARKPGQGYSAQDALRGLYAGQGGD